MKHTANYEIHGKLRTDCTNCAEIHLRTIPFRILHYLPKGRRSWGNSMSAFMKPYSH